jgi:hypothetical protein
MVTVGFGSAAGRRGPCRVAVSVAPASRKRKEISAAGTGGAIGLARWGRASLPTALGFGSACKTSALVSAAWSATGPRAGNVVSTEDELENTFRAHWNLHRNVVPQEEENFSRRGLCRAKRQHRC